MKQQADFPQGHRRTREIETEDKNIRCEVLIIYMPEGQSRKASGHVVNEPLPENELGYAHIANMKVLVPFNTVGSSSSFQVLSDQLWGERNLAIIDGVAQRTPRQRKRK